MTNETKTPEIEEQPESNKEKIKTIIEKFRQVRDAIDKYLIGLPVAWSITQEREAFINQAAAMISLEEIENYKKFYQQLEIDKVFGSGNTSDIKYNSRILIAAQLIEKLRSQK